MADIKKPFNFTISKSKSELRKEKSSSLSGKQIETRNRLAFKKELIELGLSDADIEIALSLQNY
ncbi:hypothetical protein [Shewanella oncorhynchi]|uniref:hypothetical protein n=1 Tax=Shewanella oncorhynchi TaxID=2726434 RepID=UPI003D7B0A7B